MNIHCNAGVSKTELKGELGQLTMHHNPNSIVNVLSLKVVVEKHRVTYDSWIGTECSRYTPQIGWWSSSRVSMDYIMWTCPSKGISSNICL
jgi:hypothetical protein